MAKREMRARGPVGGVPTIKVLRGARKLVANELTWTKDRTARTVDGSGCEPTDSHAAAFSADGAIVRVGRRLGLSGDDLSPLFGAMAAIAGDTLDVINDFRGRRAALSVIDAAIRELGYTP